MNHGPRCRLAVVGVGVRVAGGGDVARYAVRRQRHRVARRLLLNLSAADRDPLCDGTRRSVLRPVRVILASCQL